VGVAQRLVDARQHTFEIAIDVIVPEPQHFETLPGQMGVALSVPPRMRIQVMLTAVNAR
jgi:hypothetical protein